MASPETRLGAFVTDLEFDRLSDGEVETVRRAFVDTTGVALAGAMEGAGEATYRQAGIDPKDATPGELLGIDADEPPSEVALRLGTASHALDYDDLSWRMDGHPSVTLIPALFALAEEADATGSELLTAYAAGFEAECAIAGPISPDHYESGWHATATFGPFGAAAAASKLLGLDADQIGRALGVAASMPAGLKRNFGSMTKPLHAGLAARSGVTAAKLAEDGFTADRTPVSGDRGFWDLYGPDDRSEFELPNRRVLETDGIHVKAYPCCYFTHTSIAAAQALTGENEVDPEEVRRVDVRASRGAADALHHADPETGLEAKFSMEYAVASGVVRDRVGLSTFEDGALDDPQMQRVRERVDFSVDSSLPYDSHEAEVTLVTDEDTFERRQSDPPGTHRDPLTDGELRAKFDECARRAIPAEQVRGLYETLSRLETVSHPVDALTSGR
ncbi:MmgE/PrpD family protein (plasmid) [Halorussus salilacus]|uniref:MmgE/PrpD family protein n=1 Tax=Halorussus salilacus TaxID=2953750 RepID=UPI00209FD945|nr:MmgE/PrpD family protein [Halorussus salilacus]USZ70171.1 MmgE/PrpD family protein [Halorussus salilacus]